MPANKYPRLSNESVTALVQYAEAYMRGTPFPLGGSSQSQAFGATILDLADAQSRIAELEQQLAEARKDAERYQWMRTSAMIEGTPRSRNGYRISWPAISADPPTDGGNYRDRFDTAIDAARQKEGK